VLKLVFFAIMAASVLLNLLGATLNFLGTASVHSIGQTPTPTASPTASVTPMPTPCYPDDPKKECPTPSPTAQPVPTTSPTMHP
jgi:hypothetical protein